MARRQRKGLIADRTGLAATDLQHQGGNALDMGDGGREVDPPLEAVTGLGGEIEAARAALDGLWPPERGLDEDVGGGKRDGGDIAAHDAGQCFHTFTVCDHADLVINGHGLPIEEFHLFAGVAPADMQVAAGDLVGVEYVRRPAQFEHDVVGDIHQCGDRALAGALQTVFHPLRRGGCSVDALDQAP